MLILPEMKGRQGEFILVGILALPVGNTAVSVFCPLVFVGDATTTIGKGVATKAKRMDRSRPWL